MWLINANTLELEACDPPSRDVALGTYLFDAYSSGASNGPLEYSILSHRWQTGEVTFADMHDAEIRCTRPGWNKIKRCCDESLRRGINHVWIDTCCIDKTNIAELSESIKSMYSWYQQAKICFVYMHDLTPNLPNSFNDSGWFTRGWTLQELVAPPLIEFFDRDWKRFGDKSSLKRQIASTTNIDLALLEGTRSVDSFSVAERMSWASQRRTTRAEDRAYSLLGIFDVDITTDYGEGGLRAFNRLQQAIIAASEDHTIFAWPRTYEPDNIGMLALAPNAFKTSACMKIVHARKHRKPMAFTSRGLSITVSMAPWTTDIYLALLNCANSEQLAEYSHSRGSGQVGIFLHKLYGDDTFVRVSVDGRDMIENLSDYFSTTKERWPFFKDVAIYVRQNGLTRGERALIATAKGYGFRISANLLGMHFKDEFRAKLVKGPETSWNNTAYALTKGPAPYNYNLFGTLDLTQQKMKIELIRLFLDWEFNPVIFLAESSAVHRESKVFNKTGGFNIGEMSDRTWTDKEREEFKSFHERTTLDHFGWNEVRKISGRDVAMRNNFRAGLWMLKGDRMDGLVVELEGLGNSGYSSNARLRVWRDAVSTAETGLSYWSVDVENVLFSGNVKKMTLKS